MAWGPSDWIALVAVLVSPVGAIGVAWFSARQREAKRDGTARDASPARSAAVLGDAVPASSSRGTIVGSWWFGSIVRTVLALLALMALAFAGDRYVAFDLEFQLNFRRDTWLWLSWIGAAGAAGILFGLATWLPLTRVRYAWSRLLLAAVPLVPLAQFWWVEFYQFPRHGEAGGWLVRAAWLWDPWEQFALATLAGVAIASGFRAKGSEAFSAAE